MGINGSVMDQRVMSQWRVMWDMNESRISESEWSWLWHDSLSYDSFICDMTHWSSFIVTELIDPWLIYMNFDCDRTHWSMTHLYESWLWHDSLIHDSFIWILIVTWLIDPWLLFMWLHWLWHDSLIHDSFICGMTLELWLSHMWHDSLFQMWHHSYARINQSQTVYMSHELKTHESRTEGTWYVTRFLAQMWHDSYTCVFSSWLMYTASMS